MAGRLVLVIDADLLAATRLACADLAARLADQVGMPVTVAAAPVSRLDALEHSLRRDAEAAGPGWLSVTCDSPTMAAWMCAVIILENVGARLEDDRLLLPAGPDYGLTDEVKSIITVVAKTHHYWQAHVADAGRIAPEI